MFLICVRYKDLINSVPDDLKNTWYCQKIIGKLEKYGVVGVPFVIALSLK